MTILPSSRQKVASMTSPLVDVVVVLRRPSDDSVPTPAQSKKIATAVLRNASRETGLTPAASTIFENLHSFSVRATTQFVDALSHSREVDQVLSNSDTPELIRPVKKSRVHI
jgi:zona occludens toxin (predicted ATPase)